MQLSSNSNAILQADIRRHHTYAAQFRWAVLQMRDRTMALEGYQVSRRLQELKIEDKRSKQAVSMSARDKERIELEIRLIEMEISRTDEAIEDAVRELSVSKSEIERIKNEAGIDFDSLPVPQFQALMAEEYEQQRIHQISVQLLTGILGCSIDFAETLLELPELEQVRLLNAAQSKILPLLSTPALMQLTGVLEESYE